MDCQSTSRDRKSVAGTSEGAKKPNYLSRVARSGNRQALDDLFASSSSHLYQAAFRILSNPHDAEVAVQDSLLCAFRNLNQFHGRAKFSTWLHRIRHQLVSDAITQAEVPTRVSARTCLYKQGTGFTWN
jgi:DNA-directed RNA polymerase specialized sigma24 family protein